MPVNPAMFTPDEQQRLCRWETVDIGGKRYRMCSGCMQVIRVNKPIFGSLHVCGEGEEKPDA